ncbi:MAG TPA: acyl-CoA dehydrogenase family protein [Pseudonocardiaceae bacterium]|nr:acyl-CoA dehydrogenase family protein [Pseudonocardiaceae bacterium]
MRLVDDDTQAELRATARKLFARELPLELVHARLEQDSVLDPGWWRELAGLGWLGLLVPDETGAPPGRFADLVVLAEEAGAAVAPLPLAAVAALSLGVPELADGLASGDVVPAVHCGTGVTARRDGDTWLLDGRATLVEAAAEATHLLVRAGATDFLVTGDAPGRTVTTTHTLDLTRRFHTVDLAAVPAVALPADPVMLALRAAGTRVLACADMLGAGRRLLDLTTGHLADRVQFGRPLAGFQALKHICADMRAWVDAATVTVRAAADAVDTARGNLTELRRAVAAAVVVAAELMPALAGQALQLHGGIGMTWEHHLHLFLRRIATDQVLPGPAAEHARVLATPAADHPATDDPYRQRVRDYIAAHRPPIERRIGHRAPRSADELTTLKAWGRALFDGGLYGGHWPVEWGGDGAAHDPGHEVVVAEELAMADVPTPPGVNNHASHAILHFGSPEQQRYFLPRLRAYQDVWSQGFSEPEAGSDLASLRTTALPDGDGHYVVDGQKVWTTNSIWADYLFLLARTDPAAERHAGLSCFAVDMRLPGIDVRPLREITGTADFGEVFFDSVRVPASAMIGEPGTGWRIARSTLAAERGSLAAGQVLLERGVRRLAGIAGTVRDGDGRPLAEDDEVAGRIGRLAAFARAATLIGVRNRTRPPDRPEVAAAVEKLFFSERYVEVAECAVRLLGGHPDVADADLPYWTEMFLYARAYTISGGSNQIMRNVIAERGLGMPREVRQ